MVDPAYQDKGYGSAFIKSVMYQQSKKSNSKFAIGVDERNPRAKALYERLGFKVTREEVFLAPFHY